MARSRICRIATAVFAAAAALGAVIVPARAAADQAARAASHRAARAAPDQAARAAADKAARAAPHRAARAAADQAARAAPHRAARAAPRQGARAAVLSPTQAAARATGYLLQAQNADGGFGAAPGQPSNQLFAGWAALGLAAAGRSLHTVSRGPGLLAYVRADAATDPGSVERTILVLRAAGLPASAQGRDLVAELERDIRPDGSVARQVNWTAFAVMALRAAGVNPPARTLRWLVAQQDRDGGFSFATAGGSSDADDTGAALEALAGDPAAAAARARAVTYLRTIQDRDGGFPSQSGLGSNAQSTAWVVQGLVAAGVPPATVRRRGGPSPLQYLASLTQASGAVDYSHGQSQTPVWVTAEALMALEGRPLPLPPPVGSRRSRSAHRSAASRRAHNRAHGPAVRSRPATAAGASGPLAPGALLAVIGVAEAVALALAGLG